MRPSELGWMATTLPRGHLTGGLFSSTIITTSFSFRFWQTSCHFALVCRLTKYSSFHRFQKVSIIFWHRPQLVNLLTGTSSTSSARGCWNNGLPAVKLLGVNTSRSDGSSDIGTIGLELRQASILVNAVLKWFGVNFWSPIVRRRWCLKAFTPASHIPPWWGEAGVMNIQLVPKLASSSCSFLQT